MDVDANHLAVNRTARYYTLGKWNAAIQHVWFVCHGYGQLAYYFIKNFKTLNDGQNLVVAPEALSRFYLKGFEGRIGATWMTKEDRLTEINDYVNYLDLLYEKVFTHIDRQQIKVHLLGFSQGAATVSRWLALGKVEVENLILWAGLWPPDLQFEVNRHKLLNAKTYLVYGNDDPFRDEKKIRERKAIVEQEGVAYEEITFEGEHNIPEAPLRQVAERCWGD